MTQPTVPPGGMPALRRGIRVELTLSEETWASRVGIARELYAEGNLEHHTFEQPTRIANIQAHVIGAIGELAAAKALDIHWSHAERPYTWGLHDLGDDLEVRATRYRSGHLLIRSKDDPDRRYILVSGQAPVVYVVGWIWGREAKTDRWWRELDHRPAYWIPQEYLRSMESLELAKAT